MLACWYLLASAVCFTVYAVDKAAARAYRRRVPERTLHLLSLIGGWPGALLAQKTLRHKSRKTAFQFMYWGGVVLNVAALMGALWWVA